ncbi:tetratricopeptide repeat protein [Lederbergia wuyishanensis]|uniref:Tetratricopeptide (TPR) repeat protein n=1 Tax=Lederbergia wuyishanensis TaxID=1347903 RepID=A0ABU0D0X4_9BACI|nr:tetratricopeptide repeat protein [Lederbergia wuyishanensis]MCJ8006671.1 tetratricopeptide repeat protein [Lederbergia wuyishanensis]MDQ0342053.1 tetratricopeptide (TPR) repeat protein [Lederbergia wuyishanensis]
MNNAELMIKYIEEQNLSKAEKQFKKVKISGTDDEKYMLALSLTQYGFLEEARELFEILLHIYPDEGELKLNLAELLVEMGQDDDAFQYLETISKDDPNYPAALLVEADLYEMQGLFEVSENKLLKAKELIPNEPVIDYALGELYMTQGRFLEAARSFSFLLQGNDKEIEGIDINSRMAEALSAGGAFEEALTYYKKSLKNKKDIDQLFAYGLTAYQSSQYNVAIKAFKELLEIDPHYHSLYLYLARSLEHEEKMDEALEIAEAGLKEDEYNKDLHFFAGKLALKIGQENNAEQFFRQALVLDPEYTEAAISLNRLLIRQERYEAVLEITEMFFEGGDADPQFHWDAAISFQHLEQYQEALNEYELAYNDFKNNQDFLVDYGYFLMEEGNGRAASDIFKMLVEKDPANVEWVSLLERLEEY